MEDSNEATFAYCDFPSEHWTCICTNNVIEWLNWEVCHRTCMVGSFPNGNFALMLVCAGCTLCLHLIGQQEVHEYGTQGGCHRGYLHFGWRDLRQIPYMSHTSL